MTKQMFSGFGMNMSDPFANDPFFNRGSSFGNIQKMMTEMNEGLRMGDGN